MALILALLGGAVGVLINSAADSLPVARRLERPMCPYCKTPRPLPAWSGVVAYLTRHYRCPHCGAPISIRHVVVELATALLFAFCYLRYGLTTEGVFDAFYGVVFLLVVVTDLEHRLILHSVMLPAIAIALLGAFLNPAFDAPLRSFLGGAIGLAGTLFLYILGGVFVKVLGKLRGRRISEVAFGFGDVTLTTFIGLAVGAPEVIFAIVIGIFAGGVGSVLYLLIRGLIQRRYRRFTAIPYGPFLVLGGVVMLYFGPEFMAWYTGS